MQDVNAAVTLLEKCPEKFRLWCEPCRVISLPYINVNLSKAQTPKVVNGFVSTMCSRWFNLPQFLKGNANKYINEQSYKGGREVLWVHRDLLEEGDVRDG